MRLAVTALAENPIFNEWAAMMWASISLLLLPSPCYNLNGCDHSAVSLLLNTCHVNSVPNINKPVYCLKRADFDKMKCLFINGIDQLCFEHDEAKKNKKNKCYVSKLVTD